MMMTTVAAAMLTLSAAGASFASGLGTINAGALLQQHPQYAKTMASWQSDVKSAQQDFQKELKKTNDKAAQQAQQPAAQQKPPAAKGWQRRSA